MSPGPRCALSSAPLPATAPVSPVSRRPPGGGPLAGAGGGARSPSWPVPPATSRPAPRSPPAAEPPSERQGRTPPRERRVPPRGRLTRRQVPRRWTAPPAGVGGVLPRVGGPPSHLNPLPALLGKHGECPPPSGIPPQPCDRFCSSDDNCPGSERCCSTGCGRECRLPTGGEGVPATPAAAPNEPVLCPPRWGGGGRTTRTAATSGSGACSPASPLPRPRNAPGPGSSEHSCCPWGASPPRAGVGGPCTRSPHSQPLWCRGTGCPLLPARRTWGWAPQGWAVGTGRGRQGSDPAGHHQPRGASVRGWTLTW